MLTVTTNYIYQEIAVACYLSKLEWYSVNTIFEELNVYFQIANFSILKPNKAMTVSTCVISTKIVFVVWLILMLFTRFFIVM